MQFVEKDNILTQEKEKEADKWTSIRYHKDAILKGLDAQLAKVRT